MISKHILWVVHLLRGCASSHSTEGVKPFMHHQYLIEQLYIVYFNIEII